MTDVYKELREQLEEHWESQEEGTTEQDSESDSWILSTPEGDFGVIYRDVNEDWHLALRTAGGRLDHVYPVHNVSRAKRWAAAAIGKSREAAK